MSEPTPKQNRFQGIPGLVDGSCSTLGAALPVLRPHEVLLLCLPARDLRPTAAAAE
jgi:hypothetical protein